MVTTLCRSSFAEVFNRRRDYPVARNLHHARVHSPSIFIELKLIYITSTGVVVIYFIVVASTQDRRDLRTHKRNYAFWDTVHQRSFWSLQIIKWSDMIDREKWEDMIEDEQLHKSLGDMWWHKRKQVLYCSNLHQSRIPCPERYCGSPNLLHLFHHRHLGGKL